jgi:serine/threonine-protein kinase
VFLDKLIRRKRAPHNRDVTRVGRYELLVPLGVGGMAEVFKARAAGPGGFERYVVIKRILPAHGRDPEFIRMFVDEAKILGMLHHPNVVQVYDFGDDAGTLFLALEYVDGPSLSRILRTLRAARRRVPSAIAAYIGREVCRALDYVHNLESGDGSRLDIIHRDVTPSNIVLASTGTVKLLDFGVATFSRAAQVTRSGTVKGKPAYLAPEQLEGKQIDGRVDLFALGIVMHEMLTLQHLFAGDSDLSTVKKIMEMNIPSPSAERDDVSHDLEAIVMRALARDRKQRFATAAEMARTLDDVVVASKLRMDEVAAFVAEVDRLAKLSPARTIPGYGAAVKQVRPDRRRDSMRAAGTVRARRQVTVAEDAPTRRERAVLRHLRNTGRVLASRPRATAAVAALLAAIGVGTAFGLRVTITAGRNQAAAATVSPPPAPPASTTTPTR